MKRILGIDKPLLGREKMAYIGQRPNFGLGHKIMNGLHQTIVVVNR